MNEALSFIASASVMATPANHVVILQFKDQTLQDSIIPQSYIYVFVQQRGLHFLFIPQSLAFSAKWHGTQKCIVLKDTHDRIISNFFWIQRNDKACFHYYSSDESAMALTASL